MTAVELSHAHVALLRLKLAAAQNLPDNAAFHQVFGHAGMTGNAGLYNRYVRVSLNDREDPGLAGCPAPGLRPADTGRAAAFA
ncbi:MAG: DUF3419 family protein [Leisingera sp.]